MYTQTTALQNFLNSYTGSNSNISVLRSAADEDSRYLKKMLTVTPYDADEVTPEMLASARSTLQKAGIRASRNPGKAFTQFQVYRDRLRSYSDQEFAKAWVESLRFN